MSNKNYNIDPHSYLERASRCLEHGNTEHLFYAAFELRCFVESRQFQYLEAQKQYVDSMPRHWKVGQQSKELKKIFDIEKIQKTTNIFSDGFEFVYLYIPVSTKLKNNAEKIGELMHSQAKEVTIKDRNNIGNFLTETLSLASHCLSGNLLAPMLLNSKTGQPAGNIQLMLDNEQLQELKPRLIPNDPFVAHVEYLSNEV